MGQLFFIKNFFRKVYKGEELFGKKNFVAIKSIKLSVNSKGVNNIITNLLFQIFPIYIREVNIL